MTTEGQSAVSAGGTPRAGAERSVTDSVRDSYYGRPVLKEPVWTWEIPLYFFTGGLAGASAPLAAVAGLRGEDDLARRAAVTAAVAGAGLSPALLISDLGVPRRFLNMLRVLKVTSPMSVGAWVLAAFGPAACASAGWRLGLLPRWAGASGEAVAAVLGPVLGTYTAALLATTSVPAWHEARRELPFVFAGSCLTSAGAVATAVAPHDQTGAARRMAVAGAVLELAASEVMERRLGDLAAPYREGTSGRLMKAAKGFTLAGAAAMALGRRRPPLALGAAGALTLGALAERWAVYKAGFASVADPAATVAPQRARRDGSRAVA